MANTTATSVQIAKYRQKPISVLPSRIFIASIPSAPGYRGRAILGAGSGAAKREEAPLRFA
ncbi:MAG: hypothetical protein ABWY34_05085, partial [Pseudoxanthomonas sp.]